jgi:predicted metal-binding protein
MKEFEVPQCKVHVLVCTNERDNGKDSCGPIGGKACFLALKERTKREGRAASHWVTRTGCLGFCNPVGAVVKIERAEGDRWFKGVQEADLELLWKAIES